MMDYSWWRTQHEAPTRVFTKAELQELFASCQRSSAVVDPRICAICLIDIERADYPRHMREDHGYTSLISGEEGPGAARSLFERPWRWYVWAMIGAALLGAYLIGGA